MPTLLSHGNRFRFDNKRKQKSGFDAIYLIHFAPSPCSGSSGDYSRSESSLHRRSKLYDSLSLGFAFYGHLPSHSPSPPLSSFRSFNSCSRAKMGISRKQFLVSSSSPPLPLCRLQKHIFLISHSGGESTSIPVIPLLHVIVIKSIRGSGHLERVAREHEMRIVIT